MLGQAHELGILRTALVMCRRCVPLMQLFQLTSLCCLGRASRVTLLMFDEHGLLWVHDDVA